MLVACRLAGLSALERYYAGGQSARATAVLVRQIAELASARSAQRRIRSRRETKSGSLIWGEISTLRTFPVVAAPPPPRPLVDRIERLVPAPDGGDDFVWIGGPGEGLRFLIVLFEEAVDRGLQVGD